MGSSLHTTPHREVAHQNNRIEQDHRSIKGGHQLMGGFKSFEAASCFYIGNDELRNFFREGVKFKSGALRRPQQKAGMEIYQSLITAA